jgi:hypothetical protein
MGCIHGRFDSQFDHNHHSRAQMLKSLVVMDVHGFIQGILADYYPSAAA